MELDEAIKGMLTTREFLRSKPGIDDALFISEQMQRLTQYTGAVEEHLAQFEEALETDETALFNGYLKQGKSVNAAETLTKQEVGPSKGNIAKLKRYVDSSWKIIGVSQSRWNHLNKQTVGQV